MKKDSKKKEGSFKGVKNEIKQVRWPSKKEMGKYSLAVLLCIIILSVFFTTSDVIISAVKSFLGGL